MDDTLYMREAYAEAKLAYDLGEVPIGCVIVRGGEVIGRGHNRRVTEKNVLYHAEIIAINEACGHAGDWRLENCRIYVTIEPCPMCAGAILQARIPVVLYGAKNPKAGCAGSILNLFDDPRFNHKAGVISGILEEDCAALMKAFFLKFRAKANIGQISD
jgi:tRNA(adenine34) deaminase